MKIKKLNSSYFDRNGNGVYDDGYKSTAQNMREVAYLLDTSIWTPIFANEYVDYAIGGPTIEMIVKVLNNLEENENIQYAAKAVNEDGYRVSKDNGKTWLEELSLVNVRPITNSRLGEFEKFSKGDYWVASPSASYWYYYDFGRPVWCICKFWGNDKYRLYHSAKNPYSVNSSGFRPVVCLKKEFKLQESSDGVGYEIVRK